VQWLSAAFRGDSAGMFAADSRAVGNSMAASMTDGLGVPDTDRRYKAFNYAGLTTANRRAGFSLGQRPWLANMGRPRALQAARVPFMDDPLVLDTRAIDALFWDGDPIEGAKGIARFAQSQRPASGGTALVRRVSELAAIALWSLDRGPALLLPPAEIELKGIAAMSDTLLAQQAARLTILTIGAIRAVQSKSPNALALVTALDSAAREGTASQSLYGAVNLVSSRLWEQMGNLPNALAAVRRKDYHFASSPVFHTTYLREEGRLAEATGDREGAIKAYELFVAIRYNPEPELKPETDRIRAKLAELKRLSAGK
jgi:hypothetical protein